MADLQLGKSSSSRTILATAAIVGGLSFLAGFIGPILTSDSNLGPLLGIFVSGPLGFLLGLLIGILITAQRDAERRATAQLRWLGFAWLGAILFTLASAIGGIGWLSIMAQLSVALCALILFYFTPVRLPIGVRRSRPAILIGATLVLATSVFPPIKAPKSGHPTFAFFLDERFDASTRVPDYTVDAGALIVGWSLVAAFVGLLIFALGRARSQ